jgi:CheY-like chemotaxis protein
MAILLLSADLLFSSRVAGAAERLGSKLQTVGTPDALLEALAAADPWSLVLLDLNTFGWSISEWVTRMREAPQPPRAIVAYGPHVHTQRLDEATAAGCDAVLTRGHFNAQMDAVLAEYV